MDRSSPEYKAHHAAQQRAYKERYPDRVKESYRRWRANRRSRGEPNKNAQYRKNYKKRYLWKHKARKLFQQAVKRGLLIRPNRCSRCGVTCYPHGHHQDYTKPKQVIWLCHSCHVEEHFGGANERASHFQ